MWHTEHCCRLVAGCRVGRLGSAAGWLLCWSAHLRTAHPTGQFPRTANSPGGQPGKAPRLQGQAARTPAYWEGSLWGVAGNIPEFMWSPRVLVSLLILRKRNHMFSESSKDTRTPIELVNHTASPSYWASPISEGPCWSSSSTRAQGPQTISITVRACFRMGPPNDLASHEQFRSRCRLAHAAAMLSVNPPHN